MIMKEVRTGDIVVVPINSELDYGIVYSVFESDNLVGVKVRDIVYMYDVNDLQEPPDPNL